MFKQCFDILFVLLSLVFITPMALITYFLVKLTSPGPALYWSERVGVNNKLFNMPKFRSMKINTTASATHLMNQ